MREYLEQILHQSIQEHPYESLEKLPLGCRNAFALSIVEIQKQEILIAAPIETMNLTELRKMRIQLERYTGFQCVFYLKKQTGIQFLRWWKKEFLLYGKIIRYTFLLWGYFCKEMNTENRSVVLSFHF